MPRSRAAGRARRRRSGAAAVGPARLRAAAAVGRAAAAGRRARRRLRRPPGRDARVDVADRRRRGGVRGVRAATRRSARCSPGSPPGSRCSPRRTGSSARRRRPSFRWLLLGLAVGFALASLVLRGARPRHAELMVVTGGLAILAIFLVAAAGALLGAFLPFGDASESGLLPGFWELVLLVAGCGLVAYGAVDRVPGAALARRRAARRLRRRRERRGGRHAALVAAAPARTRRRGPRRRPAPALAAAARARGLLRRAAARLAHRRGGRRRRPRAQRRAAVPLGCRG